MKLLRVLRILDDLAEVVLFDVMLATPRRRRLCALAAGTIGLAAYVSSGFWMAPHTSPRFPERIERAAPAMPGLPAEQVEIAAEIVRVGKIEPGRQAALERALEYHRFELDRFVSLAGGTDLQMQYTCSALGLARVSTVATMLLARGVIYAHDEPSAAVRDWLTVVRMSDALSQQDRIPEHAVASALLCTAVPLLDKVVRTSELMEAELATIAEMLMHRRTLTQTYTTHFMEEGRQIRRMLEHYALTNELPAAYRGLRFYLPVKASNRKAVATRAANLIDGHLAGLALATVQGEHLPPRAPLSIVHLGGWNWHLTEGAGWGDRAATLWSNDRAADVVAALLLCWRSRASEAYATTLQKTEREAAELAKLCLSKF